MHFFFRSFGAMVPSTVFVRLFEEQFQPYCQMLPIIVCCRVSALALDPFKIFSGMSLIPHKMHTATPLIHCQVSNLAHSGIQRQFIYCGQFVYL